MLDIGFQELLVLMVIALLVFGPDKLPDLGRRLGRAMREFRRASDEFRSTIETNLSLHEESILPPSAAPSSSTTPDAVAPTTPMAEPGPGAAAALTALEQGERAEAPPGPAASEPQESLDATTALPPREPFCMRRGARLLHRTDCGWAGRRIPETERVAVKSASEGWELGLRPCPVCNPQEAVPDA